MTPTELADAIDELLPQTQCRQCGYSGCRPYAEAVASGAAGSNQCPPGGEQGAREIARVAGVAYRPVDPKYGVTKPPAVAVIDEAVCIGCTLCIVACPVDAIVGATKRMHTVIAAHCTGCELCVPPCPVDCISIRATSAPATARLQRDAAARARVRFERRTSRLARKRTAARASHESGERRIDRKLVDDAIARARTRLARRGIVKK